MKKLIMLLPILIAGCANTVEIEDSARYKCGSEIVKVDFLEDDTIILNTNGSDYVLNRLVSEDGAKYQGKNIAFLNKDGKANLEIDGKKYSNCKEIVR